ncbi:MAG: helix-turn-helix transcriptional regulator [Mycobacteriaceae bacterium]|nr:helix-turn-helix transcriptional regulator [Mycobacteriaceae bacterium]
MTLTPNRHSGPAPQRPSPDQRPEVPGGPVEFWSTAAIGSALKNGDIATWQQIAAALNRDPYGRTARQVEEVLTVTGQHGISNALREVLDRARMQLEADERHEVAQHIRLLMDRSGLTLQEFASRIGVPSSALADYLNAKTSPAASMMVRMRRLSDRFVKQRTERFP